MALASRRRRGRHEEHRATQLTDCVTAYASPDSEPNVLRHMLIIFKAQQIWFLKIRLVNLARNLIWIIGLNYIFT